MYPVRPFVRCYSRYCYIAKGNISSIIDTISTWHTTATALCWGPCVCLCVYTLVCLCVAFLKLFGRVCLPARLASLDSATINTVSCHG